MKLAEALIMRSDTQKRIHQLWDRLQSNLHVQEGEEPSLNPAALLAEIEHTHKQLEQLIKSINRTNATTPFDETRTIADALAERDIISSRRQMLNNVIQQLMHRQDRYSRSEIRMITTVDATDLQKQIDKLSKEFRNLDTQIQEKNWRTELIEA